MPPPGECHVWWFRVGASTADMALLDDSEREHAARLRLDHVRSAFVGSRATQRRVCATYLGIPAREVSIRRHCRTCDRQHGRPSIPNAGFDFSVSHTRDWLIVAVVGTAGHGPGVPRVGVDVESPGSVRDFRELVSRVFSPGEAALHAQLAEAQRAADFIRVWTRKEAATKVTGHGLSAPFTELDSTRDVLGVGDVPGWPTEVPVHLLDLAAPPGHQAAVASTRSVQTVVEHWCDDRAALA